MLLIAPSFSFEGCYSSDKNLESLINAGHSTTTNIAGKRKNTNGKMSFTEVLAAASSATCLL
jgi:hypothetical protein